MRIPRLPWREILLGLGALVVVGGAYLAWNAFFGAPAAARYKTATVGLGDITQTVAANGTLNPVVLVNVGTQVSGTIKKLHVDYNDRVQANQVLAELDPALPAAQLAQSEANLTSASAALKTAEAQERRIRTLFDKRYVTRADMDQAEQALETGRAQVAQARAQVARDQTNLGNTVIRSPVAGVVVARDVDVGQTVAASFQTPTLFKIAQDLRRMQIDTSVAESDIGSVREGQAVSFGVDAFPERTFQGTVRQVRLNPAILQNVVTYNVVVAVDNSDETLIPGMTAHVSVITAQKKGVLRVPNGALRFRPRDEADEPRAVRAEGKKKTAQGATVYRLEGNALAAVAVRIGVTDSRFTEVLGDELKAGDVVVTEERKAAANAKGNSSSFRIRLF